MLSSRFAILAILVASTLPLLLTTACGRQTLAPVVMGGPDTKSAKEPAASTPPHSIKEPVAIATAVVPMPKVKPAFETTQPLPAENVSVTVQSGDTVYALSRRHDVGVRDIIRNNGLKPPYKLLVGQIIHLPIARYHTVRPGETLYGLSLHYGVDMSVLVRANRIPSPYRLVVGGRLYLPGSIPKTQQESAIAPARTATVPERPVKQVRKGMPSKPPPLAAKYFLWPAEGRLLSGFGPKEGGLHNDGINFAVPRGAPLRAAENGVVAYAGNELPGYGNLLLIRHASGWMSAYAHNERLLVERGQIVDRGQIISRAGSSGNVSSPQAHFELRRNGKPVNPVKYLSRL
ncbi:MAG: peptidase M23 [Rhodospirillaceae bacterium]|nr:peptidase M23 [Rhodospirillaceae bacterium]